MPLIRTPEENFENLVDYPFKPNYMEIDGARLHYVDEGVGETILCLHGEPTWSYLYRKMIPLLSPHYRVVAPDFLGFGKSDKFTETGEYSFFMHRDMLIRFIETLDLQNITVVVQDWGGLIGLPVVAARPDRFARLVVLNTFLPTGEEPPNKAFLDWQEFARRVKRLPIGRIIRQGTYQPIEKEILQGYEAPFPGEEYKAGARIWPALAPTKPEMPGAAEMKQTRAFLKTWDKPALVMFSNKDPILSGAVLFFRNLIPTARDQPTTVIRDAGHFLQEDKGEEIAGHILDFMGRT